MPRTWELQVEPWQKLIAGRAYSMRVLSVGKSKAAKGIRVILEHLDATQAGRKQEIVLPLPLHPDGITADFFRACGMQVATGDSISPKDVIGMTVNVRFASTPDDKHQPTAFEPAPDEETQNEQHAA